MTMATHLSHCELQDTFSLRSLGHRRPSIQRGETLRLQESQIYRILRFFPKAIYTRWGKFCSQVKVKIFCLHQHNCLQINSLPHTSWEDKNNIVKMKSQWTSLQASKIRQLEILPSKWPTDRPVHCRVECRATSVATKKTTLVVSILRFPSQKSRTEEEGKKNNKFKAGLGGRPLAAAAEIQENESASCWPETHTLRQKASLASHLLHSSFQFSLCQFWNVVSRLLRGVITDEAQK